MLEIPEALTIARQVNETLRGKRIVSVVANASPHKFAWFHEDPAGYGELLVGQTISHAEAPGGKVEIAVGNAMLLFGDGVALRLYRQGELRPAKHQLLVEFDDGTALAASVQMYGGLWCFTPGDFHNVYYQVAKEKPSPLSADFDREYFINMLSAPAVQKLSAKAFLATEQRIPGFGNGVLQDILYNAGIHPKRKVNTLTPVDVENLFVAITTTLNEMTEQGGRDTEKDLYGEPGGYRTRLSSKTHGQPCERCGSLIAKESYMGGAIYYCTTCQAL